MILAHSLSLAHWITIPHSTTSTGEPPASHQWPPSTPPPSHSFRQCEDIQCVACGTWGYSASHCSSLAKAALLQTAYILANPSQPCWKCGATASRKTAYLTSMWMIFMKQIFCRSVILPSMNDNKFGFVEWLSERVTTLLLGLFYCRFLFLWLHLVPP
jgi:hypothetical protein